MVMLMILMLIMIMIMMMMMMMVMVMMIVTCVLGSYHLIVTNRHGPILGNLDWDLPHYEILYSITTRVITYNCSTFDYVPGHFINIINRIESYYISPNLWHQKFDLLWCRLEVVWQNFVLFSYHKWVSWLS